MNQTRLDLESFAARMPEAAAALRTLSRVSSEGLDKALVELLKVRASQLNGCANCLQLHTDWARKAGVPQLKLDRVAGWQIAPEFDARERAALAWAEALHDPSRHGGIEAARHTLYQTFGADQALKLTVAVATINAWNRIIGPLEFTAPATT